MPAHPLHRRFLPLVLLAAVCLQSAPLHAGVTIVKSENDKRAYESFVLPNRLKVLLISDPDTDKAAAAMDVFVGSGSDPAKRPGLAHFLEHMLFLGTEKYPQAGEYQAFISTHAGSHNAYTAFEHTNYFFDIDTDYLEPALDRFAQFFVAPLFSPEYVEREKNAVHSEYQSRKRDDNTRLHHVWKRVANPAHPFSQFSVGSLDTLSDRDNENVRDQLISFYRRHYSANVMALVVLGREPTGVLKQWVQDRFAAVADRNAAPLDIREPLFEAGRLPARIDVVPLKDRRVMRLTFPIPAVQAYFRAKPVDHIANLLGHEGKGSLFALLKARGWADRLSAGAVMSYRDSATLDVTIDLSINGLEHVTEIGSLVFQYIRLIREQGITEWLFDEQKTINDIAFRFQDEPEPIGYVRSLAHNLQIYPTEDVLRGPYAMDRYDRSAISLFLDRLTPDNVLLTVNANGMRTDTKDPWFDTAYRLQPLDARTVARWKSDPVDPGLSIPRRNEFLPVDLAVKPSREPTAHPVRLKRTPGLEVWFQQDTAFVVPKADFYISVRSRRANDTPEHAVLTQLYVKLVNDSLNEFYYPAYLAGLKYDLYKHSRGFSVRVSGFHDKQRVLIDRIAAALIAPAISDAGFKLARQDLAENLMNTRREPPHRQAVIEVPKLLLHPHWTEERQLSHLQRLTIDDMRRFIPRLLEEIDVVVLAHGNLHRADAIALAGVLEKQLLTRSKPGKVPRSQVVKLSPGTDYLRPLVINHPDSAIAVYLQGADKSLGTRALVSLVAQVLSSPFYSDLRTDKQLGYIVYATALPLLEVPGIAFVVESPTADPAALQRNVERFLSGYADTVAQMSSTEFENHKQGLLTLLLQEDKTLRERSDRYWHEIDQQSYAFDSREQLAEAVGSITQARFVEFYRAFLLQATRRRLIVSNNGNAHARSPIEPGPKRAVIDDPDVFKQNQAYFPRY